MEHDWEIVVKEKSRDISGDHLACKRCGIHKNDWFMWNLPGWDKARVAGLEKNKLPDCDEVIVEAVMNS